MEWSTSLPISDTQPYTFTDDENAVSKLKENLKMNVYATADNCMDKLKSDYDIDDSYTPEQQRILAGIRYEMQLRGFSLSNRFTLAEDVPLNVVTELKERGVTLPGMDTSRKHFVPLHRAMWCPTRSVRLDRSMRRNTKS